LVQLELTSEDRILVAISGGIDSMVLSNLLLRCGLYHSVAHVDHHTRDGQSTEDRYFVENYATINNLTCYIHNLSPKEPKGNFHDWAHKERYKFFASLGYDKILTAHHRDDEVETIFLNFLNGRSVAGIPEINGPVLRPLLQFSKADIIAYATEHHLEYREDSSNTENKYLRNLIRNQILPDLTTVIDNNVSQRLISLSERTRQDQLLLTSLITDKIRPERKNGQLRILKENLQDYSSTFLYHIIKEYGFGRDICSQIHSSLSHKGATFYTDDKICVVGSDHLIIDTKPVLWEPLQVDLTQLPLSIIINNYRFTLSIEDTADRLHDKNACTIPTCLLASDMFIRRWENGDAIKPLGMGGKRKKLKKVFSDKKIDLIEKQTVPIFTHKDEVIWVPSIMNSEDYKVEKDGPFLLISKITFP